LYNRRGFEALARKQLKMADRLGKLVSSIFIDVDELKVINDTFGHREGDLVLIETARLLRETFRESDIIARIGGDEFVVLAMESPGGGHGEQWTARLREKLHARNAHPDRRVSLSLSIGIAHYDPDFPCALDDLLDRADALMYDEKRRTRRRRPRGPAPRYGGAGEPDAAPRAD
jgi:two-component system cell cycle response regulator